MRHPFANHRWITIGFTLIAAGLILRLIANLIG